MWISLPPLSKTFLTVKSPTADCVGKPGVGKIHVVPGRKSRENHVAACILNDGRGMAGRRVNGVVVVEERTSEETTRGVSLVDACSTVEAW